MYHASFASVRASHIHKYWRFQFVYQFRFVLRSSILTCTFAIKLSFLVIRTQLFMHSNPFAKQPSSHRSHSTHFSVHTMDIRKKKKIYFSKLNFRTYRLAVLFFHTSFLKSDWGALQEFLFGHECASARIFCFVLFLCVVVAMKVAKTAASIQIWCAGWYFVFFVEQRIIYCLCCGDGDGIFLFHFCLKHRKFWDRRGERWRKSVSAFIEEKTL